MALSKISGNNQTNETWRLRVDAGIDLLNRDILQANTTITVHAVNDARVTGHHTINYTSSNALQDAINALPKNMSGHSLTIQFQNGTYNFGSTQIYVIDFTGSVVILGDQSDSGSGTYNVILQGSSSSANGIISCRRCQDVIIKHLEFQATGGDLNYLVKGQTSNVVVYRCKFIKTGGTGTRGVHMFDNSISRVAECHFSGLVYAVYALQNSDVFVRDCEDFGTQPVNGMAAVRGSIVKPTASVIDGSSANYVVASGGLITNGQGLILEETILQADKTVNIPAGSSASDIQNLIDEQPKNLNNHSLTFQFADDTYDLNTTQLVFNGFVGGILTIQGNISNTLASDGTGLAVKLQNEKTGGSGAILLGRCTRCVIKKIAFEQNGSNTDTNLLNIVESSNGVVESCSFNSLNGSNTNDGIVVSSSANVTVDSCGFNNLIYNVIARDTSRVHSKGTFTFSGGTDATRNLRSQEGSIVTQDSVQAGGGNSRSADSGAVLFDKDGATT